MLLSKLLNRHLNNNVVLDQFKSGNEENIICLYNKDDSLTKKTRIQWNKTLYDLALKHEMYKLLEVIKKTK